MSTYDIGDKEIPLGKEYKHLTGLIEDMMKELQQAKDELINLNHPHPIMTRTEVAEFLKVDVRSITNMVNRGELTPYYIGSLPRFKRRDVEACLKKANVELFDSSNFKH